MPGMDIHAALTVVGDGPVGPIGQQLDAHFGLPEGHHQRDWAVGMKFVVDLPDDTPLKPGHGPAHVRFSRAGDLRLPLRASRPRRVAGHLRAVVVRQPGAHRLPLPAALDAAPVSLALPQGRHAALVGREDAAGIRPARRAALSPATATRASAKAPAARTCSPAPAWTKPGPPARNSPKPCSNCSRRRSRSQSKTSTPPTCNAAAQAGWTRKPASPKNRATVSKRGLLRGLLGMALAGLTNGRINLPGKPMPPHERAFPTSRSTSATASPPPRSRELRSECVAKARRCTTR